MCVTPNDRLWKSQISLAGLLLSFVDLRGQAAVQQSLPTR